MIHPEDRSSCHLISSGRQFRVKPRFMSLLKHGCDNFLLSQGRERIPDGERLLNDQSVVHVFR